MRLKSKINSYSKKLINDNRGLLWIVTVGGLLLAFYCVHKNYTASLPWISAMVGLPWTGHATICAFYLNKSKAENTSSDGTGITFAKAQARGFMEEYACMKERFTQNNYDYTVDDIIRDYSNKNSPSI